MAIEPDSVGRYELAGFFNLREGGGMPAGEGRIRLGRLLRSDFPSAVNSEANGFFRELPLAAVVDLRDLDEAKASAHLFQDAGFEVIERPIFTGSVASMATGVPSIEQLYTTMVQRFAPQVASAVGDVADAIGSGAVLVHCWAGKVRTGVVIGLVQSLLGVRDDDVVASYARTQANLSGKWLQTMRARLKELAIHNPQFAGVDEDEIEPLLVGSPPEAIQSMLDRVREASGSVEGFLLDNGLTAQQAGKLRSDLLER